MIQPEVGKLDQVCAQLNKTEKNYTVYKKVDIPELYRIKNHHRVSGLLVVADVGYTII